MYDGLLHFFLSPEDIVPVVALALLAGLRGPEYGRRALFLLPASWFVGCFLGTMFQWAASWPVAAISFLVFGGLVAANAQVSLRAMTVLAGLLGLVHGWMNGAGVPWSFSLIGAYAGLVAGVFVVVALVSAFVIRLRPPGRGSQCAWREAGLLPPDCCCWDGRRDADKRRQVARRFRSGLLTLNCSFYFLCQFTNSFGIRTSKNTAVNSLE